MLNKKQNIGSALETALFVVIMMSFMLVFSNHRQIPKDDFIRQECVSVPDYSKSNAIMAEIEGLPLFQKDWITLTNHLHFRFSDNNLKTFIDNKIVTQRSIFLTQYNLKIKPKINQKFYRFLFSVNNKEPLILS